MSVSKTQIANEYPLPVYNYRVEIGKDAVAFSEVSGLTIAYETTVYKESLVEPGVGPRTMLMPAQATPPTITFKKGIVRAVSLLQLYGWIRTVQVNQIEKKDVTVRLCDEKGDAVISWKIHNAFPTKLSAPTFDAKSNDAAIESMELKADLISLSEP
jgi:phage tail-like protein